MTNSVPRPGKRERLVASAQALFHERGVHATSLAEVAERADVPLGNVYYYFKSKRMLVGAVVDLYLDQAGALVDASGRSRSPRARLKALVQSWVDRRETVARLGCPMGTLCAELGKCDIADLDGDPAQVLAVMIDWAESQFHELGRADAHDLALSLIAGVQGAALLASTFRDPEILVRQGRDLQAWIDSLAG
jgi:TetR/AcrR family transcriptional regulator, transcriptional repressor for nem operon